MTADAALTIAIPTYNRHAVLATALERLLPQVDTRCRVLIVDNASSTPVVDVVKPLAARYPAADVRIVRNVTNLGMAGNFLRCFELADTPWLWLLGDDDLVKRDAVETVLAHASRYADAVFVNFQIRQLPRAAPVVCRGVTDLVARLDNFGVLLFASAGLYRMDRVRPALRFGYTYAYTMAPHLAVLLAALQEDGIAVLANAQTIEQQSAGGLQDQWSRLDAAMAMPTLLEMPMSDAARRRLSRMIAANIPLEAATYQLLGTLVRGQDTRRAALFFHDQVWRRGYYYSQTPLQVLKRGFYRALLFAPTIGFRFFVWVKTRRGRTVDQMAVPGRYDRTE